MAEVDGNRTRQRQVLPLNGVEDRAGHQAGYTSLDHDHILAHLPEVCESDRVGTIDL
jgi:hypothetical protein